ncbi:MAG: hypothetical protein ACREPY_18240 [Rhodanobacteraceae bacterium]
MPSEREKVVVIPGLREAQNPESSLSDQKLDSGFGLWPPRNDQSMWTLT